MQQILAITNAHDRPDILAAQIHNYNLGMTGNVVHAININSNFQEEFWESATKQGVDFSQFGNVVFNSPSTPTCYGSIVHAYFQTIMFAIRRNIAFDYIYFHTPSDLLIRLNVDKYIAQFDIGFPIPYEYSYSDTRNFTQHQGKDPWVDRMSMNDGLFLLLERLGHTVAHRVRTEGMFFKRSLFFEIIFPWLLDSGLQYVSNAPQPYPFEETELASCTEFFTKRREVRRVRNIVHVVEGKLAGGIDISDVNQALLQADILGIKRPPNELNCPVRHYIKEIMTCRDC